MEIKNTAQVRVEVINHQKIDGDSNIVKETGIGSCREKNGRFYIMYTSKAENEENHVIIIADSMGVRIKRSGVSRSEMIYNTGKKTFFAYHTPYGTMDMEIETHSIHNGLSERGGTLKLVYTLRIQGMSTYNSTEIRIRN